MSLWDYICFIYIWSQRPKMYLWDYICFIYIWSQRPKMSLWDYICFIYIWSQRPKMSLWDYIFNIHIWSQITKNYCLGLVPETKNVSLGLHMFYIYLVPDNQKSLSGTGPRDQKCLFG